MRVRVPFLAPKKEKKIMNKFDIKKYKELVDKFVGKKIYYCHTYHLRYKSHHEIQVDAYTICGVEYNPNSDKYMLCWRGESGSWGGQVDHEFAHSTKQEAFQNAKNKAIEDITKEAEMFKKNCDVLEQIYQ